MSCSRKMKVHLSEHICFAIFNSTKRNRIDTVAERSKALRLGRSPKGRRFEPCRYHFSQNHFPRHDNNVWSVVFSQRAEGMSPSDSVAEWSKARHSSCRGEIRVGSNPTAVILRWCFLYSNKNNNAKTTSFLIRSVLSVTSRPDKNVSWI